MDLLSLLKRKRTSYQCSTGSDAGKNRRRVEKKLQITNKRVLSKDIKR